MKIPLKIVNPANPTADDAVLIVDADGAHVVTLILHGTSHISQHRGRDLLDEAAQSILDGLSNLEGKV